MEVSQNALIREMDTDELMLHLHELGTTLQDEPQYTGAWYYDQVQQVKKQYRQLNNEELTRDTPGLTIAASAMVSAPVNAFN